MIPLKTVTDKQIRSMLRQGYKPLELSRDLDVPLKRICRLQSGGRSAHDPDRPPARVINRYHVEGTAAAPTPHFAGYWQGLSEPELPRPRRVARMVPDDRRDEFGFNDALEMMVNGFRQGLTEAAGVVEMGLNMLTGKGRGAA